MNQNQSTPFEVHIKSYEEDCYCHSPVSKYIEHLLCSTQKGELAWRPSRAEIGAVEHRWGGVVVRLKYEIVDTRYERFTLSMRRAGDLYAAFTMVAQHHSCIEAPDELRDLWRAVQEYIECEQADFPFKHMEEYIASSNENSLTDELSAIVTSACREIIKLVNEQK